jgi:hypothetical protein
MMKQHAHQSEDLKLQPAKPLPGWVGEPRFWVMPQGFRRHVHRLQSHLVSASERQAAATERLQGWRPAAVGPPGVAVPHTPRAPYIPGARLPSTGRAAAPPFPSDLGLPGWRGCPCQAEGSATARRGVPAVRGSLPSVLRWRGWGAASPTLLALCPLGVPGAKSGADSGQPSPDRPICNAPVPMRECSAEGREASVVGPALALPTSNVPSRAEVQAVSGVGVSPAPPTLSARSPVAAEGAGNSAPDPPTWSAPPLAAAPLENGSTATRPTGSGPFAAGRGTGGSGAAPDLPTGSPPSGGAGC